MVHRKEVYEEIKKENQAAAQVKAEDISAFGAPDPATSKPDAARAAPGPKGAPQDDHKGS
jgi:hypothetical protein